jgi:hypothetical protein
MYSISVKCLIFTLIIDFYLLFDQSTGGKKKKCVTPLNSQKKNKLALYQKIEFKHFFLTLCQIPMSSAKLF